MTPSAVLFDLFDTLVLLDRSRLPEVAGLQPVNLCWKHGEDAVRFWHGFDEGYAQRKPLP